MRLQKIIDFFRSKHILWYAGIALVILGALGIAYGIWICYNGVLLVNDHSDAIFTLLDTLGMSREDGSRALILFGSVLIILYLLTLGIGILGVISASHYVRRRNLFWFAIILAALFALLGIVKILSWVMTGITIGLLLFYTFGMFVKYNSDQKKLKRKKELKAFNKEQNRSGDLTSG